jgi:hypothetical protein
MSASDCACRGMGPVGFNQLSAINHEPVLDKTLTCLRTQAANSHNVMAARPERLSPAASDRRFVRAFSLLHGHSVNAYKCPFD